MSASRPSLTLEKAKKICSHFTPVKNPSTGKVRCISLEDGDDAEVCAHPQHFLCDLVTWKRSFDRKEKQNDANAMSPSRVDCIDTCARKYAFRYVYKVPSQAPDPIYFRVGDAFTVARAKLDIGLTLGDSVDLRQIRKDIPPPEAAKLRAALRFYDQERPYPPGTRACELEAHFEHNGQWFFGYLDAMTVEAPHSIEEWKYAASSYDNLRIARQAAVYLKAFPQATRFVLWVFNKSQLRIRRNEDSSEFENRVFDDFIKKGKAKVISKSVLKRSDIDVDSILDQMTSKSRLLPVLDELGYPPSYKSCNDCREYRSLCAKNLGASTSQIMKDIEKERKWESSMAESSPA